MGEIKLSFRLWRRARARVGGRYRVGPGLIEVDAIDVVPFGVIGPDDVVAAGEPDLESLRRRAAHAGSITEGTMLFRIRFHPVLDFHPLEEPPPSQRSGARTPRHRRG